MFIEKVVAEKQSDLFSANNTKTGIVPWCRAKLLIEKQDSLIIEIETIMGNKHCDTLIKRKLLE